MVTEMNEKMCVNCRFFDPFIDGAGECRRKCPVVKFVGKETKAAFPIIGSNDWCGEWETDEELTGQFGRMSKARREKVMKNARS
jgi:hypothetical protein